MASLGALGAVLPELEALRGVEQSAYHHADVYEHTLEVLDRAGRADRAGEPRAARRRSRSAANAQRVAALLDEPLADEMTRGQALRWGALLHDAAKPLTRAVQPADGRVTFMGHDALGAELAREVLARLRASERLRAHVAALVRHHLRLGFLVHEPQPLARRTVYRYLRARAPVEADVTLLSVADRLATRGRRAERGDRRAPAAGARACSTTRCAGTSSRRRRRSLRGDELARRARDRARARSWGALLEELAEARYAGEISSREQAVSYARTILGGRAGAPAWLGSAPMSDPDCIFCKIVAGELPAQIVDEDERTIAFMDIAPATRGHALVIPREHTPRPARGRRGGPAGQRSRRRSGSPAARASGSGRTA